MLSKRESREIELREIKISTAKSFLENKQPDDALQLGKSMLSEDVGDPEAWRIVGAAYGDKGNFSDAEDAFLEVVKLDSKDINAWFVLHFIYFTTGRLAQAIEALATVLEIDPKSEKAVTDLFELIKVIGGPSQDDITIRDLFTTLIDVLDRALEKDLEAPDLSNVKFCIQMIMGDLASAKNTILANLKKYPNDAGTLNNYAILLRSFGRSDEAYEYFREAAITSPRLVAPKFGIADTLLRRGDFKDGWSMYEYRWLDDSCNSHRAKTAIPLWDGGFVEKLLVWPEQGIGEEIMFASLYDYLSSACCRELSVVCDRRLIKLYEKAFTGNIKFISSDYFKHNQGSLAGIYADAQLPIGSIPLAVGLTAADQKICGRPFLSADKSQSAMLRDELVCQPDAIVIGVSWRTSTGSNTRLSRNISLQRLISAVATNSKRPISFVCLQYGDVDDDLCSIETSLGVKVHKPLDLDLFNDLYSLAALTAACDYVVTIDNMTVHLAGALGVPTHVLLPANPDWRWGASSNKSYWYSDVSIIRQSELGDWSTPLQSIESEHWT